MQLFLLFILPILFTISFFLLLRRSNGRTGKSFPSTLPPSPSRLPIIGNLHQLSSLPHLSLQKLSQKLGPIMLLHMGQVQTVVVSSPELAAEVLKTQDQAFASRPTFKSADLLMNGQRNLSFAKYGEHWRTVRKVCVMELLNPKKVQGFRWVREEGLQRMLERIRRELSSSNSSHGALLDLTEIFYEFSNGSIFRASTGSLPDSTAATKFRKLIDETTVLLSGFPIEDAFPSLGWIGKATGLDRKLMDLARKLDVFFDEILAQHEEGGAPDFVDVLLSLPKDPQMALSNDDIKLLIQDLNAAGTDATHAVLEWTMSELLRNPEVMSKAKREISEVVGGRSLVEEDDFPQLRYLKAVLKEVLRLHPPAPLLIPHESMQETQLQGYTVPERTRVVVNVWALGRDPRWWDSPEEFSPERFMVEEETDGGGDYKGQDFRFLPFGSGRRSCPGMHFAMASVELAMANLLNQFDWRLPAGAEELDMSQAPGITVKRAIPLRVLARSCSI